MLHIPALWDWGENSVLGRHVKQHCMHHTDYNCAHSDRMSTEAENWRSIQLAFAESRMQNVKY